MSRVKNYYRHRGVIIRHVFKDGGWFYDTPFSLILWDTLKEAQEAVDRWADRNPEKAQKLLRQSDGDADA
jgi:hypothetical protein